MGKTVAISGSTGGIGRELCAILADLGASLILLDRNPELSAAHRERLLSAHPDASVVCIPIQLDDPASVRDAAERLREYPVDVFISNAGAYSIPRKVCESGYDNVFQINFVSPYILITELLPTLRKRRGRVVIVGSIAHNYSKSDSSDIDFSTRQKASLVYGNSKRYLMFTLAEAFKNEPDVSLAITHPGITFTNITAHYPPLIFALIKHPMKIIFPKPRRACLSIIRGVFEDTRGCEWIGPRYFDVWGLPKKKRLSTVGESELEYFRKWSKDYAERKDNAQKGLS
ncbi:MAG: SDR family NAD(P)-dependent oxidoreductase [Clostridia bacterium]|nr:SDR family NAD(P)-dependent oxidoreductase [Clostridia bacterium]